MGWVSPGYPQKVPDTRYLPQPNPADTSLDFWNDGLPAIPAVINIYIA